MSTANRVIKNTGFLYAKMGITVFISLYTTRLVLDALGTSDFGIFNVVGGAIAMLGFLNAAMASSTQRFMSFYEGKGEKEKQKQIFNVSFVLHFFIALGLGLILLIVGYFFFNGILNILPERVYAAKIVYGSLIISTMFTVMSVPYEAVLNAHENMLYYSVVGILESLLKLGVAITIFYYIGDKLEIYGILMACIPLLILSIMRIYCHKKYVECVVAPKKYWDAKLIKEMTSFAGWNLLGSSSSMLAQYGMGIVLNMFFGTRVNAAQGVAGQVSGQLGSFALIMLKALNPILAKSEGAGDRSMMIKASLIGGKFSFFLLVLFYVTIIVEMPFVFNLWLKEVPEYAVIFCRLLLVRNLIEQLYLTLGSSILAVGDIKEYQIVCGVVNFAPLIATYFFFQLNYEPYFMYVVFICYAIIKGLVVLYYAKQKCELSISSFFKEVMVPCLFIFALNIGVGLIPTFFMDEGFVRFSSVAIISISAFFMLMWMIGLKQEEKLLIKNIILTQARKLNIISKE